MHSTTDRVLTPLFTELRGARVLVRPYQESDAPGVFEAIAESREHLGPWEAFASEQQTVADSRCCIRRQMAAWLLREDMSAGFWEQATGRYLGGCTLHPRDWVARSFEIGYWMRASAAGQGYVTETVRLLTDYAFTALRARRVAVYCDERNERSAAVPGRLGFVQEGRLRNDSLTPLGQLRTTLVFALTAEDWQAHRGGEDAGRAGV
jgi:RimJ/RimL family protein N-acetyltransferase